MTAAWGGLQSAIFSWGSVSGSPPSVEGPILGVALCWACIMDSPSVIIILISQRKMGQSVGSSPLAAADAPMCTAHPGFRHHIVDGLSGVRRYQMLAGYGNCLQHMTCSTLKKFPTYLKQPLVHFYPFLNTYTILVTTIVMKFKGSPALLPVCA